MVLRRFTSKVVSVGRQPTTETITHSVAVQTGTCSVAVQTKITCVKLLEPVKMDAARVATSDHAASCELLARREASPLPSPHHSRSASVEPASGAVTLGRPVCVCILCICTFCYPRHAYYSVLLSV